jgi:hypothetical protein
VGSPLPTLLHRAVHAARTALRDLDGDQVPADLRRVVAHSGRLTPPLHAALVRAIDKYEWLREQALEAWPDADVGAGDPAESASALFLERPAGWAVQVAEAAARAAAGSAADAAGETEGEVERLQGEVDALRSRVKAERKRGDERAARLSGQLDEARARLRTDRVAKSRGEEAVRRRLDDAESARSTLAAEVDRLHEAVRTLKQAAAVERSRRAAAEHALAERHAGAGWVSGDPVQMAIRLDDIAAMTRPAGRVAPVAAAPGPDPMELPTATRPDEAGAIDWVLARTTPTTVVVDGYNAAFTLWGPGDPGEARARLGPILERLARLACAPLRVIVVYDSSLDDAQSDRTVGSLTERFTPPETIADEEVVALAAETTGAVVVVSDDREVREGAEKGGAMALWSAALGAWERSRR